MRKLESKVITLRRQKIECYGSADLYITEKNELIMKNRFTGTLHPFPDGKYIINLHKKEINELR